MENRPEEIQLTHGSLFSGIGGFDLGFSWAGFKTLWQVELDEWCRRVLERRFPDATRFKDIRLVDHYDLRPVTVITGGFPCQPFSLAGKRRGASDHRNLWPEMRRIVSECRPPWVVCENVPGLGAYLNTVCDDLEAIGYEVAPPLDVPAVAFGAPHRRHRLWIVAHHQGKRVESQSCAGSSGNISASDSKSQQVGIAGQSRPHRGMEQALADATSDAGQFQSCEGQALRDQSAINGSTRPVAFSLRQRCQRWPCLPQTPETHGGLPTEGACSWGPPEPVLRRMDDGLSRRVDGRVWRERIKMLGNSIVPQIAEHIGRLIYLIEKS